MSKILAFVKISFKQRLDKKYLLRNIGFVMMLLAAVFYMIFDGGALKIENYSRNIAFYCILGALLLEVVDVFVPQKEVRFIIPILSVTLYGIAFGRQLYLTAYPLADRMTGVNWFGGSLTIYMSFLIVFLAGLVLNIVQAFTFKENQ